MTTSLDLSALPAPQVIEELDYEATLARQNADFQSRWAQVRADNPTVALPAYDVVMLETDPPAIINEAESYRETVLRARVNEAARSQLLAFATGSDLDHLAAFYDVTRMAGEMDDRLKLRVILAIQGRSTAGTEPRYRLVALSSDLTVADAIVYTVGRSPVVRVAVFSTGPDGVASPALLAKVSAALNDPAVRMVNDTIEVATAVRTVVNIAADIWLLPDADAGTLARAELSLRDAWAAERALGRDLIASWWVSKLMIAGVHKIAPLSPIGDIAVSPAEAVSIGTVTLTLRGRDF